MTDQEQSQLRQHLADQFQNMIADPPGGYQLDDLSAPPAILTAPPSQPQGAGDRRDPGVGGGDWRGGGSYRRPESSVTSREPTNNTTEAPAGSLPRWGDPPAPTLSYQLPAGRSSSAPSPNYTPIPSYTPPSPEAGTLAEWPQRALGFLIDFAPLVAVYVIAIPMTAVVVPALWLLVWSIFNLAAFGWTVFLAVQFGQSGSTPGMRMAGLRAVGKTSGQPIGAGMGILRALAHVVDGFFFIGWLFPLWDGDKQTLADKIVGTVVVTVPKQGYALTAKA